MGMDVMGKDPSSKKGEYFRNNCWWWRPLWDYCCMVMPSIDNEKGQYNDGYGLDGEGSKELARRLVAELDSGMTAIYAEQYKKLQDEAPDVTCWLCKGSGKRNDDVIKGECNACKGTGKTRPDITHYPFAVDNVWAFSEFLKECGGFQIY